MTIDQEQMDEVNRQIKMGWSRGYYFGLVLGVIGTLVAGFIIKLLW